MAKLYTYDAQIDGYVQAFKGNVMLQQVAASGFMSSIAYLAGLRPSTVKDVASFNQGYLYLCQNVYVSTPSELKFNQPDFVGVYELPRLEIDNPKFKTRQRRGEIIMADYRRGSVTVRCAQRLVRSESSDSPVVYGGWESISESNYPGLGDLIHAAFKQQLNVSYDRLVVNIKGIHRWTVKLSTGLRYESVSPSYPITYPSRQDSAAVVTSALAEAMSTQMDVLTELVEMPSTLAFIQGACVKAVDATLRHDQRRRRVLRRASKLGVPLPKTLDRLATLELQFRYALMPIVYSIQSASSLLQEYGYLYREARNSMHFPVSFSDEYGVWEGNDKVSCLVKQKFDPDSVARRVHSLVGPNPVTTLWEITTLSFVVDWVVPIGDYLTALTTPVVSDELKSSLAFRCSRYCSYTSPSGLKREIFIESYEREIINPHDHIGLRVNPSMNWNRWLDASALSWSGARSKLSNLK